MHVDGFVHEFGGGFGGNGKLFISNPGRTGRAMTGRIDAIIVEGFINVVMRRQAGLGIG
eukprot:CAMPEP_0116573266 /NCGR_PEP_ID=MMETSP0397-20121206/18685_1 /TAXON_ID=216820 /ORGANISM="Cyclophora tenuis, Strain ECT3854" /LENGTH=58 /DNA_ID=CAMNT_0004101785 /DNA_START=92 /DNA_END=265 /DNA_ORIENTATION=+